MSACRICSSQDKTALFTKDNLPIVKCSSCGLEYTDISPRQEELKSFYGEKYFKSEGKGTSYFDYISEEPVIALNSAKRLEKIKRIKGISPDGKLLDIGCATGVFLNVAKPFINVSGIELSEYASSRARDFYKLPVKTGALKDAAFPDKDFDIVTMWDVIEHLDDPAGDLKEVRRIMKDDGLLVLATGDSGSFIARISGRHWHLYNPDQHLSYFSEDTIRLLLKRAGFKILKLKRSGSWFTLDYLASSLKMYYPSFITNFIHKMIAGSFLKKISFYVNLGDIMTVYAAKTSTN